MIEVILGDLVSAWLAACAPDTPAPQIQALEIIERKVFDGAPPKSKGELIVDVHASGIGARGSENLIVIVQHRIEPLFPHRAALYSAADIVAQHLADSKLTAHRPVHSIAFCDYGFSKGIHGTGMGSTLTRSTTWRKSIKHKPDVASALHLYSLLPCTNQMTRLGQKGNVALNAELAGRLSFVFVLLPHAPLLEELTVSTPPLLRWASLIAYANPRNLDAIPKPVRSAGIERLMAILKVSVERRCLNAKALYCAALL